MNEQQKLHRLSFKKESLTESAKTVSQVLNIYVNIYSSIAQYLVFSSLYGLNSTVASILHVKFNFSRYFN